MMTLQDFLFLYYSCLQKKELWKGKSTCKTWQERSRQLKTRRNIQNHIPQERLEAASHRLSGACACEHLSLSLVKLLRVAAASDIFAKHSLSSKILLIKWLGNLEGCAVEGRGDGRAAHWFRLKGGARERRGGAGRQHHAPCRPPVVGQAGTSARQDISLRCLSVAVGGTVGSEILFICIAVCGAKNHEIENYTYAKRGKKDDLSSALFCTYCT